MKPFLLAIVFASLVAVAGVLHGMRTERWAPTSSLDEAANRLDAVPVEFGVWQGKRMAIDENGFGRFGIKKHLFCQYRHSRSGASFSVLIVCGRPGPISVHTPDVCYEGAGFQAIGAPEAREIKQDDGATQEFWSLRFRRPSGISASQLEILWAWNGGAGWAAPDNPRLTFARSPVLYKMYLIRDVSPRDKSSAADAYRDFVHDFLPVLNRALAAPVL